MARKRRGHRGPELRQRAGSRVGFQIKTYFLQFWKFSGFYKVHFHNHPRHTACAEQTFLKENLNFPDNSPN
jgi:hypothetical protein